MSEAVFNAATVGGQLFGIPTYSAIINDYDGEGNVFGTRYYLCIDKTDGSISTGPDPSLTDVWKLVGEVKVQYDAGNAKKIWRVS